MKPWKRCNLGEVDAGPECFNGATAMKSWKRRGVPFHVERNRPMLQWGHGDEAVEEIPYYALSQPLSRLQWGHGDEAVEEGPGLDRFGLPLRASMGPRR